MSDVKIEIEGDSDAAVALALLRMIATAEGKDTDGERDWFLETFAACLAVVRDAEVLDLDDEEEDEEDEAANSDGGPPHCPARSSLRGNSRAMPSRKRLISAGDLR